jgi:putative transposase
MLWDTSAIVRPPSRTKATASALYSAVKLLRVEPIVSLLKNQAACPCVHQTGNGPQGTPPGYLHADGGAAMTSKALASLLVDLDVRRSHNRPRTSNDNPFSESQFKTMKYTPDYPSRFATIGEARAWMGTFTHWYNHEHRHSGVGLHTPASVHYGTADAVRYHRRATLNTAYAAHPERFPRGRPQAPKLPERVTINDPATRRITTPAK